MVDNLYMFIRLMMTMFIPLLLVGLGGMFSERGGVMNIALEGIMIAGAWVGVFVTNRMCVAYGVPLSSIEIAHNTITSFGDRAVIYVVALLASAAVGILFSFVHSFAAIRLKADQTITATAINIFAPAFFSFLTFALALSGKAGVYKLNVDTSLFEITKVPLLGDIPYVGNALFQFTYPSFFIGIVILIVSIVVFNCTRFGLRLKACGENPYAAAAVGVKVTRYRYAGTAISGAIAAIAGFFYATCYLREYDCSVGGFGFLGLAIMIFGNWKPSLIGLAALFFSFFQTLGTGYNFFPGLSDLQINGYIFRMIPFIFTLIVLVAFSKKSRAPKYDGVPYFADRR